jgi:hypothetical protein
VCAQRDADDAVVDNASSSNVRVLFGAHTRTLTHAHHIEIDGTAERRHAGVSRRACSRVHDHNRAPA